MNPDSGVCLWLATVLTVLGACSLFTPTEFWRGLGRVALGIGIVFFGAYLYGQPAPASVASTYHLQCGAISVSGLVTAVMGWRKFRRRNLPA